MFPQNNSFEQSEAQISFTVYPLDEEQAQALRERLQDLILKEVEARGLYMGPVIVESVPQEAGDGQA